ncbi:5695_t:CDS:2 [Ambispora gerdemannii]|uniref:5695_t:CDS:1 n=1 Tax=Ambispora gerdemannii TaxID=144530 RepID=A0A9N9CR41_9GLOM|nr:5695_t:CDS:2 [Ambispora gerdemannii]
MFSLSKVIYGKPILLAVQEDIVAPQNSQGVGKQNWIKTDPQQKVIGHIQFQQFPNCTVRATGVVNIFDPCGPQCEYDRVRTHYDIHVLSGFPPNKLISVVDLEDIVSANGNLDYPFQGFTTLAQPFDDLGSLKCAVMLEDPNGNESNDKVLGSAQILPA